MSVDALWAENWSRVCVSQKCLLETALAEMIEPLLSAEQRVVCLIVHDWHVRSFGLLRADVVWLADAGQKRKAAVAAPTAAERETSGAEEQAVKSKPASD